MAYTVVQMRRFARQYKRLNDLTAADVDEAIHCLVGNPRLGEKKKGDLADLRVYKFHSNKQILLLGYSLNDGLRLIYLEAVGAHENFYRDLK